MTGIIKKNTGRASGVVGASAAGVPAVTSDPPTADLAIGDVWIRTDEKKLKAYLLGTAAWSAGTTPPWGASGWAVNGSSYVDVTALCGYGGHPKGGGDNGARGDDHLHWDGSSWTTETDHPYHCSSCFVTGTDSAKLSGGGHGNPAGPNSPIHPSYSATNISTEWDGSSWGSTASLNYAGSSWDSQAGHGGTQSSSYTTSGWTGPSASNNFQTYNGSSWSSGTTLPVSGSHVCSGGPSTNITVAAMNSTSTLEWDGSSWSSGGTMGTSRSEGSRLGTTESSPGGTGFMINGGASPYMTTEVYNGSSWSSGVNAHTAPAYGESSNDQSSRGGGDTGGGNARGILMGGGSPPYPSSKIAVFTGAALAALSSPATFS